MSLLDPTSSALRAGQIRRVTLVGLVVNILLSLLKGAAGVLGNSQALIADAVHSLSDLLTDFTVLIGVRFWSAPPDEQHPHGHGRIETLVAAGIGLLLAAAGLGIGYHGILGLRTPRTEMVGLVALGAALISMVGKEILYRWTMRAGLRAKSQAVMANAWHHRSDAISSLPAALAVAGATFWPSLVLLDSLGAIVVAAFIIQAACRIFWPALTQLVDRGAPEEVNIRISTIAMETPGVRCAYAVRTRYIGSGLQVDLCIKVDPDLTVRVGHDISEEVRRRLIEEGPDVLDAVVHLEPRGSCLEDCAKNR